MQIQYFVFPNATNSGEAIPDIHAAIQSQLAAEFGGFTAVQATGGWRSETGALMIEAVTRYEIVMDTTAEKLNALRHMARGFGHMAQQEAVMLICNGVPEFLTCVHSLFSGD